MVLPALLVGLLLFAAGLAVVVVRGVGLWRQTRRTGGALGTELSSFEEKTARAERHLAEWERSNADLQRALAGLRNSRAHLQVLLGSVERAQARVRWLRVFAPR